MENHEIDLKPNADLKRFFRYLLFNDLFDIRE